jgi:hypothetical protein
LVSGRHLATSVAAAIAVVVVAGIPAASAILSGDSSAACTIAAAGDIAEQGGDQEQTAALVQSLQPTAVLTLGDNAYPSGSADDFRKYYDPSWGKFKSITHPAVGNHEYETPGASAYLDYFGVRPYYSYDVCGWHLYSLNRELSGSEREAELSWLHDDLAAHRGQPMLAVWHEPRWTSGTRHGSDEGAADLWDAVVAGGVKVVLNGHEHSYERTDEMDAQGRTSTGGTREFIVGEGGSADLSDFGHDLPATQKHISGAHGVLALTLRPDGYDWRLMQVGGTVADQGSQQVSTSRAGPGPTAVVPTSGPTETVVTPGSTDPSPTGTPSDGASNNASDDARNTASERPEEGGSTSSDAVTVTAPEGSGGATASGPDASDGSSSTGTDPPGDTAAGAPPVWTVPAPLPESPSMSAPQAGGSAAPSGSGSSQSAPVRSAPVASSAAGGGPAGLTYRWIRAAQGAYVKGTEPTTVFGSGTELTADAADPARRIAFVTFDLSGVPANAGSLSGRVYLRATTDLATRVDVYWSPSGWSQRTLDWSDQPAIGTTPLGGLGPARAGDWVSVDVTPVVRGGGQVSLALTGSSPGRTDARFASDETVTPPVLGVAWASGGEQLRPQ